MEQPQESASTVRIDFEEAPSRGYDIVVGEGVLKALPRLLADVCRAHRYVLISDDRVASPYAERVAASLRTAGARVDVLTFPAGEAHKTRETWAVLSDAMFAADVGRDAAVLALGGGVTGDLAGFVAATYMRGLPLVQLPTSLLAMIDSSVGGKTGVDTPAGKNLIGSFLQPAVVVADTTVLETLPPNELRAGLVEAVKHGAIADAAYFHRIAERVPAILALDPAEVVPLIVRSVEIKADVVRRDEREGGPRKTLNFGHTVGHAVEALSGYRLLHGEAIAIGMVVEARIGEALGITRPGTAATLREVLERLEMPVAVPAGMEMDAILAATRSDKKARQGRVEYSLIDEIGRAHEAVGRWAVAVEDVVVVGGVAG
jgi:3-dehydroquinate synthase